MIGSVLSIDLYDHKIESCSRPKLRVFLNILFRWNNEGISENFQQNFFVLKTIEF